jgi:peptide/nickel transport system substrate-binding protein
MRILPLVAALLLGAAPAVAQRTLTLATATAPTVLDPHFHNSAANNQATQHLFDALAHEDTQGAMRPGLAASWRVVDDMTWEFTLRAGVRFHDGTPFRATDVAFSIARVPLVPNSPGPFTSYVRSIAAVEVVDETTVRIRTSYANPFLDRELSLIMLLSERLHADMRTPDFATRAIGTGPYRLVSFVPGERMVMEKNPAWFREPQPWDRAELRFVTNAGARMATLLAGEVDGIDAVPPSDVQRLAGDPRLAVVSIPSYAIVYLFPDSMRETAPFVTGRDGAPIANPFRDPRVRRVLSLAVNRAALAERLLAGGAVPVEQLASATMVERPQAMPPLAYDPDAARRLLAEAGYPDGFRVTLHGPSGYYAGDEASLQAVAQFLTRAGIATSVEVIPAAPFFTRAARQEFGLFMMYYSNPLTPNALRQLVSTGAPFNRQKYSDAELDQHIARAMTTMDAGARQQATDAGMARLIDQMGVVPLVALRHAWAMRRDRATYEPSPLGRTQAMLARPAQ